MKALITSAIFATGMLTSAHAQQGNTPNYTSLKLEIENGIKTGNAYIKSKQDAKGFWNLVDMGGQLRECPQSQVHRLVQAINLIAIE